MGWSRFLHRRRWDRERAEELAAHVEHEVDLNLARGMTPDEALAAAQRKLGNTLRIREEIYRMNTLGWLDAWWRDLRYAARTLRQAPAFTLTAALTLALGIGANTGVFSVVDAVLLRPLPYPEPERLAQVVLRFRAQGRAGDNTGQDGRAWEMVRDQVSSLNAVACKMGASGVNLSTGAGAEYVQQQRVGAGYFRVLGVGPVLGREFSAEEDRPGGPAVTLLSDALWRRRFQSDPGALGRSILLRGEPHVIVGIMPPGLETTANAEVWVPARASTRGEGGGSNYAIVARLRPGVSWAQADAQLAAAGTALVRERRLRPDVSAEYRLVPLQRGMSENLRLPLLLLLGAVGLVLLICCVNVASLLLARAAGRQREIATRLALGGNRSAILRQLLAEGILLASLGSVGGLALGGIGLQFLARLAHQSFGVWQVITLDARVLAATAAIALLTSLIFGLVPALQASRTDLRGALLEGGSRSSTGSAHWPRRLLVTTEVALGMVLLVGAGLLLRTFLHLNAAHPGFDGTHVVAASLSLDDARYGDAASVRRLFDQSLARLRETPGVEAAAIGLSLPYQQALNSGFERADGPQADTQAQITDMNYVTPGYFEALRIPLLRGRVFTDRDRADTDAVFVVNEAFVRRYLSRQEALGSRLRSGKTVSQVVGVVADVQQSSGWGGFGPIAPAPTIYMPAAQVEDATFQLVHTWFAPSWIVRMPAPTAKAAEALRQAVTAVDPQLPLSSFRTLDQVRAKSLARQRVQAVLLGTLAALALLLSAVGLYGLVTQLVAERTREMGIRLVLGAKSAQIIGNVVGSGVLLACCGLLAGAGLALLGTQALGSLVWGIAPHDPLTFVIVGVLLLLVATLASAVPAWRVLRLDPANVLRHE